MRRILCAAVVCVIGLGLTAGAAEAGHSRGHVSHGGPGYRPPRWGGRVWSPVYHRYQYWDANQRCYYYYDPGCSGYVRCP